MNYRVFLASDNSECEVAVLSSIFIVFCLFPRICTREHVDWRIKLISQYQSPAAVVSMALYEKHHITYVPGGPGDILLTLYQLWWHQVTC